MPERRALILRARQRAARRATYTDGAASEVVASPKPGAGALLRAFVRPNRAQVVLAVIGFLTGLLVVLGVRAQGADADFSSMRRGDLIVMLDTLGAESRKLEAEIATLEETKRQLESGANSAQVAADEAVKRLQTMRILAGTAPATGPGVRITIMDPHRKVSPELVLDAVEEMRDAGAEVMQLNGDVRVVASTWFGRASDGSLIVNGRRVSFPLVIDAIGDPETLEAGARFRGGLVSEVQNERVGGKVTIQQLGTVSITALAVVNAPQFSRPA